MIHMGFFVVDQGSPWMHRPCAGEPEGPVGMMKRVFRCPCGFHHSVNGKVYTYPLVI